MELEELYFPRDTEFYDWLLTNHNTSKGIYVILYKLETGIATMRWEEAVKVALCFGWIDSTVKSLGDGKRRQYFCPRKPKSPWSALNKRHIIELEKSGLIQKSGYKSIKVAKENGSWTFLDAVENGVIPETLQKEFDKYPIAFKNYMNFAPSYRKSYLSWLNAAKRKETQQKRITEIIKLCNANIKSRSNW